MTAALVWAAVGLGVGVLMARRRSAVTAFVTLQTLLLVVLALTSDHPLADRLGAAGALAFRAVVLGAALLWLLVRAREPRPVRAPVTPLVRAAAAVGLALVLAAIAPPLGLASVDVERGALGLVAFGIVCVATRRLTVAQIAGLLLVENGVALAALGVPHGTSLVIELGVALDVVMISLVAVAYHARIVEEFGSGDAGELRSLRD